MASFAIAEVADLAALGGQRGVPTLGPWRNFPRPILVHMENIERDRT